MAVRLLVMRHAKSAYPAGVDDHDRPLSERGERDALAAARWLVQHAGPIDLAIVSDARRTTQTWELISGAWQSAPEAQIDRGLYLASAPDVLRTVLGRAGEARAVLVLGHNPGMHDIVLRASLPKGPFAERFPTSAIAVLRAPNWGDWRLAEFEAGAIPRG